jgi:hypothetical protein
VGDDADNNQRTFIGLRFILIASLLLFLLATLTEVYNSPEPSAIESAATHLSAEDSLIVPGTRIGPVTLGLHTSQLLGILGKGQLRPHEKGVMHLFEGLGIVIYAENDRVISVTVRNPSFQTRGGIGVGSDVSDVLQDLGQDSEQVGEGDSYVLHNWARGWHVGVKGQKVVYFQVTADLADQPPSSDRSGS